MQTLMHQSFSLHQSLALLLYSLSNQVTNKESRTINPQQPIPIQHTHASAKPTKTKDNKKNIKNMATSINIASPDKYTSIHT